MKSAADLIPVQTQVKYQPPFSRDVALVTSGHNPLASPGSIRHDPAHASKCLPAAFFDRVKGLTEIHRGDAASVRDFLKFDLDLTRIHALGKWLWLCGRPSHSRTLHWSIAMQRKVVLVEALDLHLTWVGTSLYLKPIPEYMLDYQFWLDHLCNDIDLHKASCGFLLSYIWLIAYPSDLRLAIENSLVPPETTWTEWTEFVRCLTGNLKHHSMEGIAYRFHHAELRGARLAFLQRIHPGVRQLSQFARGHGVGTFGFVSHRDFLSSNIGWIFTAFAWITIALTAMQVGLATEELGTNEAFQQASYGFTAFSLILPLALGVLLILITILAFLINLAASIRFKNRVFTRRQGMKQLTPGKP